MYEKYFLKLACFWITVLEIKGIVDNKIHIKHQSEKKLLGGENISFSGNPEMVFEASRIFQNSFGHPYISKYNWNMHSLRTKPHINYIININLIDKYYAKHFLKRYWKKRNSRNQKRKKKRNTKHQKFHSNGETGEHNSKKLRDTFKNINGISPRIKKYAEYFNDTNENNSNQSVVPITRQSTHATERLSDGKETLALNPVLGNEKSTQPEVKYIDEWKYSYRVTLYKSRNYNISNYICSGILMARQWILTSLHCSLADNMLFIIGVHSLPKIILDHNKYMIKKKIYSLRENLILIEMDRPVQWKFEAPKIRALERDEIDTLLANGKCSVLSWIAVEEKIFVLREYPQLKLKIMRHSSGSRSMKSVIEVETSQPNSLCENVLGAPVLCEGIVSGILLNVNKDCKTNLTMKLLCPALNWITFFTEEQAYLEISARKWPSTNFSERPVIEVHVIFCIFITVLLHI